MLDIFPEPVKTKQKKIGGKDFCYCSYSETVEFVCDRCQQSKKSKKIAFYKDEAGQEKHICNGCYGFLCSADK